MLCYLEIVIKYILEMRGRIKELVYIHLVSGMGFAPSIARLLGMRFEELQLHSSLNDDSDAGGGDHSTHDHSENPQEPVEVPREAAAVGFANIEPHEARVSEGDGNRVEPTDQTCKAREKGESDGYEENRQNIQRTKP